MEIRKKLTYQFVVMVAFILLVASLAIYLSFSQSRKDEFYDRLGSKAELVAKMLFDIDEIDTELLRRIERNNPLSLPNEKIIVYDYKNQIIYSNDEKSELQITTDLINKVRLEEEIRTRQEPYEIFGHFYTDQYDRIVVFAAAKDIFGMQKINRLRVILSIVFIFSLIIVFFTGRLFAAQSLQPIANIISQVDSIGVANLNARIDEGTNKDELAKLARTFNKMLERLETAFETQKDFIANASHELRTPLTVLTGELEVVLMKARQNEEYKKTIISVLEEIKSLNNVSDKLLLLAQASSGLSQVHFSQIRIDDMIWQAQNELLKRKKEYDIEVHFEPSIDDEGKLLISGNELLLKAAIGNLMDNACKYAHDKKVRVQLDCHNHFIQLRFTDHGIGIPREELDLIFQPFYRGKTTMGTKGHGIGLSLVEKIVVLHGGEISVRSKVSRGSTFTVKLPLMSRSLA